jgi:hypothetical protein
MDAVNVNSTFMDPYDRNFSASEVVLVIFAYLALMAGSIVLVGILTYIAVRIRTRLELKRDRVTPEKEPCEQAPGEPSAPL